MTAVGPVDPATVRVGFIGLGNVGGKLAGSLLRNGIAVVARDLDTALVDHFVALGAVAAESPMAVAEQCDVVITCLPSPAASAAVMEADDGVIAGLRPGTVWMEMSTTDSAEITRLGALVVAAGWLGRRLSRFGRLSPCSDRQYLDLRRNRPADVRASTTAAHHPGSPSSAHRRPWLGFGAEGGNELSRHGKPDCRDRSPDHDGRSWRGPCHHL